MRRALLPICFAVFLAGFISIIVLADQGRGFWTFLHDVPMGDKIGHLVLVGPLALLTNLVLRGRYAPRPFSKIMLGSFIVGSLMTLEEISQAFIPSRSFDLIDALMNLTAAALAQIITSAILRRHPSGSRQREKADTAGT
ncbi:MAG: VanZ family protein [Akkermansiaceae bacterium]|nr:VanZ family protein [Akkermansiaceae bacterium]